MTKKSALAYVQKVSSTLRAYAPTAPTYILLYAYTVYYKNIFINYYYYLYYPTKHITS